MIRTASGEVEHALAGPRFWRIAATVLCFCIARPALAQEAEPADVLLAARQVAADLDSLSHKLGAPDDPRSAPDVEDVAPFEVYFQAASLRDKVARLQFEQTRQVVQHLEPIPRVVRPADVLAVVEDAVSGLHEVLAAHDLPGTLRPTDRDAATTPTHVYVQIVACSRQLDGLLKEPISLGDGYRRVTEALGYALDLRLLYPGAAPPPPGVLDLDVQPRDVHARLRGVLGQVQAIAGHADQPTLSLSPGRQEDIRPADVHELASLVAAELRQLVARADLAQEYEVPHPGPRQPADVLRRVGQLGWVLDGLESAVRQNPTPLAAQAIP